MAAQPDLHLGADEPRRADRLNEAAGIAAPSRVTSPLAFSGTTRLRKFFANPSAGVATVYADWNCSNGGTIVMNGSEIVWSNVEPLEYCTTSAGLPSSISAGP